MSKEIPLTQGYVAIVDDEDYEYLMKWKWYTRRKNGTRYAERNDWKAKKRTLIMHRMIINAPDNLDVDHIDGNGLNNTRNNLRLATPTQNAANQKISSNNTSGYKGVARARNKWMAHIRISKKKTYLGVYSNAEEAARAYDKAARTYHGEFAKLNFP